MEHKKLGGVLVVVSSLLIILLTFVKLNLDKQGAFLCELVEQSPILTMAECPAHSGVASWFVLIAFGFSVILLGIGLYLLYHPSATPLSTPSQKTIAPDLKHLDPDEAKIYALLNDSNGSMYQSDLIKATGYSKVKITRILDKMMGKGIVSRERRGMTNIVVLK